MTTYDYNKSPVAIDSLTLAIQTSAIVTALDHISVLGDILSITFKAALSSGDETILDNLVDAHDGVPLPVNDVTEVKLVEDITTPKDSDGSPLSRVKVTTTGWHYQLHGIEFTTSKLNSIESKKADNTDWNFTTAKFYKLVEGVETEITGGDLTQEYLDANCIKTVIDWEPNFDIDIVGGVLKQKQPPTSRVDLWVIGAPDIPAAYGGSKLFVSNVDLELMGDGIKIDGKAPKFVPYNATVHSGKFRLIFRHEAGYKHDMHMLFEIFKV